MKKYTTEEIKQKLKQYHFELIGKYINTHTKTTVKCRCGRIFDGISTSSTAIKLHSVIEKILNTECHHNYKIEKYYIDIIDPVLKIAIEYDSYYYHRIHHQTQEKEKQIDKLMKKRGYKLLRIRSNGYDIPSEKVLKKVLLNDFQHSCKKKTITMKSWKKEQQKSRI